MVGSKLPDDSTYIQPLLRQAQAHIRGIYLICIQIQGLAKQQKIMLFLNKHIHTNVNSCMAVM